MKFAAGQQWAYAASAELAASRLVIGALVEFEGGLAIACCAVTGALEKQPDGSVSRVTVPFLPLTVAALERTVTELDGTGSLPPEFAGLFEAWQRDERGRSYFTVPFEGSLDRLIALQMTEIVERS